MRVCWIGWSIVLGLAARLTVAQPVIDPVADLFEPKRGIPAGAREQPVGPLRLPEASLGSSNADATTLRRPTAPRRPPFLLNPGDRVLFLGDALFEAEATEGYWETRLQIQYPTNAFVVRNLSASPHNRLRDADPGPAAQDSLWLTNLLEEARAVRPTVVFLSYGTGPGLGGAGNLATFSNVYARVIGGLVSLDATVPPRLVVCSPWSYEPGPRETLADATNRNQVLLPFADTAWQIATNRQVEFVDLFLFSRNDLTAAARGRESGGSTHPPLTREQVALTPYGMWRLGFALERGLRWPSANWRFGLMPDGRWREGGFGAQITSHRRTEDFVQVNFTEERLPVPHPPEPLDLLAQPMPHCYIQVRSLKEGLYELRVDGDAVLRGTHLDWNRYEVITQGPSWKQSEALRQALVNRNQLWQNTWTASRAAAASAAAAVNAADAAVAQAEADIARLKRPVPRRYEIVRIGEAPPATAEPEALKR